MIQPSTSVSVLFECTLIDTLAIVGLTTTIYLQWCPMWTSPESQIFSDLIPAPSQPLHPCQHFYPEGNEDGVYPYCPIMGSDPIGDLGTGSLLLPLDQDILCPVHQ